MSGNGRRDGSGETPVDGGAPLPSAPRKDEGGPAEEPRRKSRSRRLTRRHPDIEVARLLVKRGFVAKSAATDALKRQKARARAGKTRVPFLKLLVKAGALEEARLDEAQDEVRANTYICDNCDARAVILAGSQTRAGACPRCGHEISVGPFADSRPVPAREFTAEDSATQAWQPMRHGAALRPGQRVFSRFTLRDELGRGAMGVVYRATNEDLGRDVALKVLLPTEELREHQVARFRREAAAVMKLRHDGIAAVHDFGQEDGLYYIVMDLIEDGDTLHRALKREEPALDLDERLRLVERVARAVDHAHGRGVVHRDLKPANVLLDPQGTPYVVDFGLAKDDEAGDGELTRTHDRLGTPLFMAPEQIRRGASRVDGRADVWALGVTLFVCATGRYPFRSRTVMDLYLRIMREPPDWTGTRYSAPDRAGYRGSDERDSELATDKQQPFASTATMGSDEATEVSSRAGADGSLPKSLPAEEPRFSEAGPPPFTPPPDLAGREVPRQLRSIIECALAKDPEDRYPTAAALAEDVARFRSGSPVHARLPSALKRLRGYLGRRRVLIPLASSLAVAVVLLAALAAGFAVRDARRSEAQLRAQLQAAWGRPDDEDSYRGALESLQELARTHPEEPRVLYRRGLARARLLDLEGAWSDLSAADAALADGERTELRRRVATVQVLVAALRDDAAGLADAARRAIAGPGPLEPEQALRAAQAAFVLDDTGLRGRVEEALLSVLSRLGSQAPRAVAAYHARLALDRGRVGEARARLPDLGDLGEETDYASLLAHAAVARAGDDVAAARRYLGRARLRAVWSYRHLEGAVKYYNTLGFWKKVDGDAAAAIRANRAAGFLAPFHPAPRYYNARLHLTFRMDLAASRAAAQAALSCDPWNRGARDLYLAALEATDEGLDEATAFLERDAQRRPEDPEPLLRLAYVALRRGDVAAAEARIDAAEARASSSRRRLRLAEAAAAFLGSADDAQVEALTEDYAPTDLPDDAPGRPSRDELEHREALDRVAVARVYLDAGDPRRALECLAPVAVDRGERQRAETRRLIGARYVLEARARAALGEPVRARVALTRAAEDQAPGAGRSGSIREPMPALLVPEVLRGFPELTDLLVEDEGARSVVRALEARRDESR